MTPLTLSAMHSVFTIVEKKMGKFKWRTMYLYKGIINV